MTDTGPLRNPKVKASPATRREAAARGVDLTAVVGSGPDGRVLLEDLPGRPTAASSDPVPGPVIGSAPMQAFELIDAEPLIALKSRLNDSGRPEHARVSPATFFVAALAHTLRAVPAANGWFTEDGVIPRSGINIGIAVSTEHGLVVPVLRSADSLDFATLCVVVNELISGARAGSLGSEHFEGGTATIADFGSLGGTQATQLLRPRESIAAGFDAVALRPFVVDGAVLARNTLHIAVGADHRVIDGAVLTRLIRHLAAVLTDPAQLTK